MNVLELCAVSVAPVVGLVKDGYDLILGWRDAAQKILKDHCVASRGHSIDTGAPKAAFESLRTILKSEARQSAADASLATASFAVKTGLTFVDGGAASGPIVGAIKAFSSFAMKMTLLALEWRSTRKANEMIANDQLDIHLFATCPLLGCYMLTSATLSDLIPLECFGQPGWMDYIEKLKKRDFDGIYDGAMEVIENSLWEVVGMPKFANKSQQLFTGEAVSLAGFNNGKAVFQHGKAIIDLIPR